MTLSTSSYLKPHINPPFSHQVSKWKNKFKIIKTNVKFFLSPTLGKSPIKNNNSTLNFRNSATCMQFYLIYGTIHQKNISFDLRHRVLIVLHTFYRRFYKNNHFNLLVQCTITMLTDCRVYKSLWIGQFKVPEVFFVNYKMRITYVWKWQKEMRFLHVDRHSYYTSILTTSYGIFTTGYPNLIYKYITSMFVIRVLIIIQEKYPTLSFNLIQIFS